MSIDLSEFHDIFFEECFEGLNVMESGMLNLDHGTDIEDINTIFRAAHSIKGGSASFGFMEISSFTHVMETLLDEMRSGHRAVTRPAVDLLLISVDVLRGMVDAAKAHTDIDQTRVSEVRRKLDSLLSGNPDAGEVTQNRTIEKPVAATGDIDAETGCNPCWHISFRPDPGILQGGNEPARIFRELDAMGELTVTTDTSALPALGDIDPAQCYLGWTLQLMSEQSRSDIEELFSWVIDESKLDISPPGNMESASVPETGETPALAGPASQAIPATNDRVAARTGGNSGKESGSIRVAIDKIDDLINQVGELVITQSMLSQIGSMEHAGNDLLGKLRDGLTQLERNTRELQESVLQIRMLPISFSFSRFPRLVRDLSSMLDKKVELVLSGEQTEVDKTVLEKIGDPLVHLVRNSLDHGLEKPDVRKAAGKPPAGRLELSAYHEGGDIIIKVIDDGAGLDRERIRNKALEQGLISENEELPDERIYNLIFAPGFSTADKVSDVSGRGVGMDVVRRNIRDLGGNVTITSSPGAGSIVTIRLPLTLAILDGQLISVGHEIYIVPLINIVESIQVNPAHLGSITGQAELYKLRDLFIPIIRLNRLFDMDAGTDNLQDGLLVVVEVDDQRIGLFIDNLMGQQQVVIKSLETNFRQIQGISGATILGDGTVALILDVPGLIQRYYADCRSPRDTIADVA
ncbi:MAG: chemotaxis protein CheA [Gammaproteobacteria bacterium]